MRNLEGIRLTEIKESELEKKGIKITEAPNYVDCAITEKERLQMLRQSILNSQMQQNNENFDDCRKVQQDNNYDDCRKVQQDNNFDDCRKVI